MILKSKKSICVYYPSGEILKKVKFRPEGLEQTIEENELY